MIEQLPVVIPMPTFHPDVYWIAIGGVAIVLVALYIHAKRFLRGY